MTERYEIIKLIGKDPAGGVYLAEDTTLERKVVFRHIDCAGVDTEDQSWKEEFSTYSGKLCALQHPNLLTIFDVTFDGDGVSMVTQFIEGESIAERLEQGPLRQLSVYHMASDLLEGLHAAHTSGVFHGALHTGSVRRLPRASGGHRYLLVDLGLNKLATMVKGEDVHIADPVLLAPELHDQKNEPDVRADLFMLGQICYTAMAGGHPFAEKSPDECVQAYLAGELINLSEFAPHVQENFAAWVMHLASGEVNQRPESIKEAMEALQQITIDEPIIEPALNESGQVTVVSATPVQSTVPMVESTDAVQEAPVAMPNYIAPTQKSNKRPMIIIALLCVLIGFGLWFGLTRNGSASDDGSENATFTIPAGVKVYLHDVEMVNTLENRNKPVVVNLESENTLDWLVPTGAPSPAEKVGGQYIYAPSRKGDFKEIAMKNVPVHFKSGKGELITAAAITSEKGFKAKLGDGWQVLLRVPSKHEGSVLVSFYMTQTQIDAYFEVAVTIGNEEIGKFAIPKQNPGVIKIPFEIPEAKAGGFYTIAITTASADPKVNFTMGINAILVEQR